ncbi:hypothetical protein TPHA_0C01730 [Tetrapisispora phaffii CBS 4417]|uniref:Probable vacuolar protein sorting-associated protein 16 homolog n=1 Tax=Tetrapisispora phaffii (strain ATCC 24235 / CBS 4417 / NBRC 1672 / NRRL Y-8282 / UCD 70-5) TaxID=1071381 RepID=G8BRF3_TETPH|nr:hypothetical protein TPHA_0C01730 [Tetrapisispora phaffii CBS 4417]CCE62329.1 hypothetical protein TPHA_0C01730 [Tetrapisispora phaffii CBS 4417]
MANNPSLNWEKLQNVFYRKIELCELKSLFQKVNKNAFATNTAATIIGDRLHIMDYNSEILLTINVDRFENIKEISFDHKERPVIITSEAIHVITNFLPLEIEKTISDFNDSSEILFYKQGYVISSKSQNIYKHENGKLKLLYTNVDKYLLTTEEHWDINNDQIILLDQNHVFRFDLTKNNLGCIKTNSSWQRVIISTEGFICLFNEKFRKLQIFKSATHVSAEYTLDSSPLKIAWCGNDTIACVFDHEVRLFGPGDSYVTFWYPSTPIGLFTEVDGIKVIAGKEFSLIGRVPEHTSNVFKIGSTEAAAVLLDSQENLDNYLPKSIANLRVIDLPKAVTDCINASVDEFDVSLQKILLEASSFGKASIIKASFDSELFVKACERIKLLNYLRKIGILVTNDEYNHLTFDRVCDILKLRNNYYECLQICKITKNITKTENIFIDWACTKVLTSVDQSDDSLYDSITLRQKEIPNGQRVSMINIAHTAFLEGRLGLARKLMLLENRPELKTMGLLELDDDNMALQEVMKTYSPELILSLLLKCRPKLTVAQFTKLLILGMSDNQIFLYFAESDKEFLFDFFRQQDNYVDLARLFVFQGVKNGSLQPFLPQIRDLYAKTGSNSIVKENIQLFEKQNKLWDYQENLSSIFNENFTNLTLDKTLSKLIEMKMDKQVTDFVKKLKINDKRYYHCKCKTLIDTKRFGELHSFAKERKSPIGYLPFYKYLFKKGHKKEASVYIEFITRVTLKEKIDMYCKCENYLEAIKIAEKDQNLQELNNILKILPSDQTQLKNLINDILNGI